MSRYDPKNPDDLQPIDYVMTALENALHSGMTLEDVVELGTHAKSIAALDRAISLFSCNYQPEDFKHDEAYLIRFTNRTGPQHET